MIKISSISLWQKISEISVARLMVGAIGFMWILVIPLWLVTGSYIGKPITELLSFHVLDGWCDIPTESIGGHCFGDYSLSMHLVNETNPWANSVGVKHPYTPIGMIPHALANTLTQIVGNSRVVMIALLLLMGVTMLLPALLVVSYFQPNYWIPFVLLGVGAAPIINVIDRGTTVGFVIPLLVWLTWSFFRNRTWQFVIALSLLVGLRPQYALLALLLLATRKYFATFISGLVAAASIAAGFLIWPGDKVQNFQAWLLNISSFSDFGSLKLAYPVNLSSSKTMWDFFGLFSPFSSFAAKAQKVIEERPSLPGIMLVAIVALLILASLIVSSSAISRELLYLLVLPLPALVPGTSWSYYSVFVVVLAVVIILHPENWAWPFRKSENKNIDNARSFIKARGLNSRAFTLLLLIAIVISIVPLPGLPGVDNFSNPTTYGGPALFSSWVGPIWLLVEAALIASIALQILRGLRTLGSKSETLS